MNKDDIYLPEAELRVLRSPSESDELINSEDWYHCDRRDSHQPADGLAPDW